MSKKMLTCNEGKEYEINWSRNGDFMAEGLQAWARSIFEMRPGSGQPLRLASRGNQWITRGSSDSISCSNIRVTN